MKTPVIRSLQNPKVKAARALQHPRKSARSGKFLVEGLAHLGAALEAGWPLEALFWAPERLTSDFGQQLVAVCRRRGVPTYATSAEVLDSLSPREESQGVVAVAHIRWAALDDLSPQRHPWVVAVTTPQNPGNLGTLLRTMDAVGADALVLLDGGTSPFHPQAVRASMGAVFWLPVARADFAAFAAWARAQGYRLYGTSARGEADYRQVTYTPPLVLLLGNERQGLSEAQRAACDVLVRLPMHGRVSSLNLAVAAGVMLYAIESALSARGGETP